MYAIYLIVSNIIVSNLFVNNEYNVRNIPYCEYTYLIVSNPF